VRDKHFNMAAPPASTNGGDFNAARPGALFEIEGDRGVPAKAAAKNRAEQIRGEEIEAREEER